MGSKVSTSASAYPASRHLALLGDSTIDNAGWVPRGEPCVTDQAEEDDPDGPDGAAGVGRLVAWKRLHVPYI